MASDYTISITLMGEDQVSNSLRLAGEALDQLWQKQVLFAETPTLFGNPESLSAVIVAMEQIRLSLMQSHVEAIRLNDQIVSLVPTDLGAESFGLDTTLDTTIAIRNTLDEIDGSVYKAKVIVEVETRGANIPSAIRQGIRDASRISTGERG